jgi:hypothetical protein
MPRLANHALLNHALRHEFERDSQQTIFCLFVRPIFSEIVFPTRWRGTTFLTIR